MTSNFGEDYSFEKGFFDIGYKDTVSALEECEQFFNKQIELPYILPSVVFTHHFGRCNKEYGINNSFEIEYINEFQPKNHYTITIRPLEHAINFKPHQIQEEVKLNNGKACFITNAIHAEILVFERNGWQYMIGVDKRILGNDSLDELTKIANAFY